MEGAPVSPRGVTRYSKWLRGVLQAILHSSPSLMLTGWYAYWRSSFEKMMAPCRGSKAALIRGKGYLFLTVILFI